MTPVDLQLSVVIPTFNGAARIHLPLEALARDTAPAAGVEVVIVDNASTDGTAAAAANSPAWKRLQARGWACRIVREESRGLTYARLRGVRESSGAYIGFLDDDTAPQDGYLEAALAAFDAPQVGAVISRVSLQLEGRTPPAVLRRRHLLADNEGLGDERIDWPPGPMLAPTLGAGLWLRREALTRALTGEAAKALLADRQGKGLVGSGDIELGHRVGLAGYVRRYEPRLRLLHHIPPGRVRTGYFIRLIVGTIRGELTLQQRYQLGPTGSLRFPRAAARLIGALIAGPALLLRPDGGREFCFVLADRWARVRGPYPQPASGLSGCAPALGS